MLSNVNQIINETKSYIDVFSKLQTKNAEPETFLQMDKKLKEKFKEKDCSSRN